jgi:replication-associated recombination protein RarA|uniref:AAA+ ATPase domain-containing protein n=1 Tax=viral metagenome TaxID=1070528 RepID=A0A6C0AJR6_9ZZZZ
MYAEVFRPTGLDDVIGYADEKEALKRYLTSGTFKKAIMLAGPPGIGKTTLALTAARTFGFDPLEINASRAIRSFEDVEKIKDACRSAVNIHSFIRGEKSRKTCVILDEVDGSDPHAQNKIVEWIRDQNRKVPILCTGNELPTIFKRNSEVIETLRCFPPRPTDLQTFFPNHDVHTLMKESNHDVRRMLHRMQYGVSDTIPKYLCPPTGLPVEQMFVMRQSMFGLPDPFHEYRGDRQGNVHSLKTSSKCKTDGTRADKTESVRRPKK